MWRATRPEPFNDKPSRPAWSARVQRLVKRMKASTPTEDEYIELAHEIWWEGSTPPTNTTHWVAPMASDAVELRHWCLPRAPIVLLSSKRVTCCERYVRRLFGEYGQALGKLPFKNKIACLGLFAQQHGGKPVGLMLFVACDERAPSCTVHTPAVIS